MPRSHPARITGERRGDPPPQKKKKKKKKKHIYSPDIFVKMGFPLKYEKKI